MAKTPAQAPTNSERGPKVAPSFRVHDGIKSRDSLENLVSGLGTSRDKLVGTSFAFTELNKTQLEMSYRGDWIARKVVNIPAQDATREWRTWQIDRKDVETIEQAEEDLQVQTKVKKALQKARLYGGAGLLLGVDGAGPMNVELDPEQVKEGSLKFVHAVSRWELNAGSIEWDITSPYYGQPSYYTRSSAVGGDPMLRIHPSRVVRLLGNEVPDVHISIGWGDSILQVVRDAIVAASTVVSNGAQLLNEMKMDVIKIPGLSEYLAQDEYSKNLSDRFALANMMKGMYNLLLLDKDEEWERLTTNLTGVPDLLKMYLLVASGAADIPVTRMLGQAPAGLNSTGDGDLRNYYDNVKDEQKNVIKPAMTLFDEVFIRSSLGTQDVKGTNYTWDPLWQMDDQQRSTIMIQKANSFKTDVDAGLIPDEIMRQARLNQLINDDVYPDLQGILEDYGPLDPIVEMPPGAVIGPDGNPIAPTDPAHPNNKIIAAAQKGQPVGPVGKGAAKPGKPSAVADMATRIRLANPRSKKYRAMDGVTRTLYVYRSVLNGADILSWAKTAGIPNLVASNELHVTIMYSRTPVDWSKTGEPWNQADDGTTKLNPGGMRALQKFGNVIVLCFNSSDLSYRHCQIKENTGATWEYAEYQPHVTLAYLEPDDPQPWSETQLAMLGAYAGEIKFGPEVYAEASNTYQTGDNLMSRPGPLADGLAFNFGLRLGDYNENHDPKSGQFSGAEGGGGGGGSKASSGSKAAPAAKASRVARVKEKVGAFVKGPGKEAIGKAVKALKDKENQKQLLASGVTFSLYHLVGLDFGADLEKVIHHEVHALGENLHIGWHLAKDYMTKAVSSLRSAYAAAHIMSHTITGDALDPVPDPDYDHIMAMFDKLLEVLNSLQPSADETVGV